ncbi:MAG: hypothetical protein K0S27_1378 [Gammaproteobacteria bacterium]|jgi:hypothetical protein|nr:hypothetical protein [Gammaproteobacteria bacterium]
MDARNNQVLINRVFFIGSADNEEGFSKLMSQYPPSRRDPGTLYIITWRGRGFNFTPYFNFHWPADLYSAEEDEWTTDEDNVLQWLDLPRRQQGFELSDSSPSSVHFIQINQAIAPLIAERQQIVKGAPLIISQDFSEEEQKRIKKFFGKKMWASLKELRTILFNGECRDGTEFLSFKQVNYDTLVHFFDFVSALKKMPEEGEIHLMNSADIAGDAALQEIAESAKVLHEHLKLGRYPGDKGLKIKRLCARIVVAILGAIPGALAGFKAGAAVGAWAGGGVFSVPSALIGGGVGALVGGLGGGGLGFFAGTRIANYSTNRYLENDHSAAIDAAVAKTGAVPSSQRRLSSGSS